MGVRCDRSFSQFYCFCIVGMECFCYAHFEMVVCIACFSSTNKVERDLLKSGIIQVLPYRDKAGRKITAVIGKFGASEHSLKPKVSGVFISRQEPSHTGDELSQVII